MAIKEVKNRSRESESHKSLALQAFIDAEFSGIGDIIQAQLEWKNQNIPHIFSHNHKNVEAVN